MGTKADRDTVMIAIAIAQRETAVDAGLSVASPSGFHVDNREVKQCSQARAVTLFSRDLGEVIIVHQRCGPPLQQFRDGQIRAVPHKFWSDHLSFCWPDVAL